MKIRVKYEDSKLISIWNSYLEEKTSLDYTTLYIHFPFCYQKCNYCMHLSEILPNDTDIVDKSLDYLEEKFRLAQSTFKNEKIRAVYFGGGSQTILSAKQMDRLFSITDKYWNLEKTDKNMFAYEMHPSQVNNDKIDVLKNSFINRVSLGVQSFNKKVIQDVGRIYVSKERIFEIYDRLDRYFNRINVDFMYGLTSQTKESFINDIKDAVEHGMMRITIYGYNNETGNRPISDDEEYMDMFSRDIVHLKDYIDLSNYEQFGSNIDNNNNYNYSEFNGLLRRDKINPFLYSYNTTTDYFNNCVAFSMYPNMKIAPISYLFPLDLVFHTTDDFITMKSYMDQWGEKKVGNIIKHRRKSFDKGIMISNRTDYW